MDTEGRRRSDNFEDRGAGGGRYAAGGMLTALFGGLLRTLGVRGTLVVVAVVGGIYFLAPAGIKVVQPASEVGARSPDSSSGGCSFARTSCALAPVASIVFLTVAP